MGNFFKALKAGVIGFADGMHEANQPRPYAIAGRPVKCPHCSETKFISGTALLNSRGRTLVNMDWADPGATILVCSECGRIEWFVSAPDVAAETPTVIEVEAKEHHPPLDLSQLKDID